MSDAYPKCPRCQRHSALVVGLRQALCYTGDCEVLTFDPSLPDGGLSTPHVVEIPQELMDLLPPPEPEPATDLTRARDEGPP